MLEQVLEVNDVILAMGFLFSILGRHPLFLRPKVLLVHQPAPLDSILQGNFFLVISGVVSNLLIVVKGPVVAPK